MSSRLIANELRRNYNFLVDFNVRLADPRVNTTALNDFIINLDEDELRAGEGNLIIHLRNRVGRFVEPSLELEEGFISTVPYKHVSKGKIISTEKIMIILMNKT